MMELVSILYRQALTACVRRLLTAFGVKHDLMEDEELWAAMIDGINRKLGESTYVRPPINVQAVGAKPLLRVTLEKLSTKFPIKVEEVEAIYVKCNRSMEKTENVLLMMNMLFCDDETALKQYGIWIKSYEKDLDRDRKRILSK